MAKTAAQKLYEAQALREQQMVTGMPRIAIPPSRYSIPRGTFPPYVPQTKPPAGFWPIEPPLQQPGTELLTAGVGLGAGAFGLDPWYEGGLPGGLETGSQVSPETLAGGDYVPPGVGVGAMALPLIGGVAAAIPAVGGALATGTAWVMGKGLLQQLVKMALLGGAGGAAWGVIANLFGLSPEEAVIKAYETKPKRYAFTRNSRIGTIAKSARAMKSVLKRHEKVIRQFLPKPTVRYGVPPSRVLSAVERKAIRGGT